MQQLYRRQTLVEVTSFRLEILSHGLEQALAQRLGNAVNKPHLIKMDAFLERLFGGSGPLVQLDTAGACTSQCCDEVASESSESAHSNHTVLTHASLHEPTTDRIWETVPPCDSGNCAVAQVRWDTPGEKQATMF